MKECEGGCVVLCTVRSCNHSRDRRSRELKQGEWLQRWRVVWRGCHQEWRVGIQCVWNARKREWISMAMAMSPFSSSWTNVFPLGVWCERGGDGFDGRNWGWKWGMNLLVFYKDGQEVVFGGLGFLRPHGFGWLAGWPRGGKGFLFSWQFDDLFYIVRE